MSVTLAAAKVQNQSLLEKCQSLIRHSGSALIFNPQGHLTQKFERVDFRASESRSEGRKTGIFTTGRCKGVGHMSKESREKAVQKKACFERKESTKKKSMRRLAV